MLEGETRTKGARHLEWGVSGRQSGWEKQVERISAIAVQQDPKGRSEDTPSSKKKRETGKKGRAAGAAGAKEKKSGTQKPFHKRSKTKKSSTKTLKREKLSLP